VTVTTVLFNSEDSLQRYAEALASSVERGLVRLIAVDNASPDGSVETLKRLIPDAEMLDNRANLGFATGCNRAWPEVRSRYWMLLNPDVEADARGIEGLVEWMDEHPRVGLASPLLRDADGGAMPVARSHDSLMRPLVKTLRLHKLLPWRLRARWMPPDARGMPETFDGWLPGAALIARTEAVAEVGLLDERFFMYGEDREWCWRMTRAGWGIGICRDVEFAHGHGVSARATWDDRERMRREAAGRIEAGRRMHGRFWAGALGVVLGLSLFVVSLDPRHRELRDARRLCAGLYLRIGLGADRVP
jgi:N-acetylglucosaminyl-diphospho-decaprenol L-rhamnosyltransferase